MSALTHAACEREHLSPAETLADSRVMAVRQLRKVLRRPMYVVFAFLRACWSCSCHWPSGRSVGREGRQ